MKILITGGGRFIGRHLAKYLLNNNFEITIFDDLSNSTQDMIEPIGKVNFVKGVIKKFVNSARQNIPVLIYGKGDQTRDLIHVNEYISRAIKNIEGKKGEIYNIGTGKAISINQLASEIFSIFKKNPIVNYAEPLVADIKFSNATIDKAEKMLGYSPKIGLKEGISKTFC